MTVMTATSNGAPKPTFTARRSMSVINTHYGDDVWITNKGQSGDYVFAANDEQPSPLQELACAIAPKLFALPQNGCRFSVPSQAIDFIFKQAFYEASKTTVFAALPCMFTTVGTGFCMGITWASAFYGSLPPGASLRR